MDIWNRLKESFVSGLIMVIPVLITILIIQFLAGWVFMFIDPIVRSTQLTRYTGNIKVVAQVLAGGFVVVFITGIGYMSNYKTSARLRRSVVRVVDDIPLFGTIYKTFKQITNSFTEGGSRFRKVVLIEFPREGIHAIGLITSDSPDAIENATDKDLETVYLPLSPNPTMGNLVMVSEEEYTELDMKVSKAMKLLLTTGIAFEDDELPSEIIRSRKED